MITDLGRFTATATIPITADAPVAWINPGPETVLVLLSDVDALVSLTGPAAAETGLLLKADNYVRCRLDPGASVSALAASAAGTLRVTRGGEG